MKDDVLVNTGRKQLGERVRQLRHRQELTLREVSAKIGLSESTLSKIEHGSLSVSYDNLVRLAAALSIDLAELFTEIAKPTTPTLPSARRSLTRAGEGEVYESAQYRYEMLCTDLAAKKLIPMVATLQKRAGEAAEDLIQHPGEEFVYVLEGVVVVRTEHYTPMRLNVGDSLFFDSTMKHSLMSAGDTPARIIWVATGNVQNTVNGLRGPMESSRAHKPWASASSGLQLTRKPRRLGRANRKR